MRRILLMITIPALLAPPAYSIEKAVEELRTEVDRVKAGATN
jgi:hypothetical protein